MMFWVISLGLAAVAAAILVRAFRRGNDSSGREGFDVQVYRDQLREVERDLARGVVTESEADAIRTEVSRRLLDADKADREASTATGAPTALTRVTAALTALGVIGGAGWLYFEVGAPGYPDLPLERRIAMAEEQRQNRIGQAEAEAMVGAPSNSADQSDPGYLELVERLRAAVAERPDDLEGQRLVAREEARLGNFTEAHEAQARVIELLGPEAGAGDYSQLADLLIVAANGYVSPEAETALNQALRRDPEDGVARYYLGLLAVQTGRPDIAFRLWRALLEEGPADAPWIRPIRADIASLAERAGVRYTPPSALPGPDAGDMAAAQELSPEERMDMIRGMVSNLSDRLATEGGSPEEWARLIRAYGVLGETDRASAIWTEAQNVFPEETAIAPIREAARSAGVAE